MAARRIGWAGWAVLCTAMAASADPKITISPPSLPSGTAGQPYSQTLQANQCSKTCTWSWSGTLPPGLSLGAMTGVISGTPSQSGTFAFSVTATDAESRSGSQNYTLTITAPSPTLTFSGLPDSAGSAQQISFAVALSTPAGRTVRGQIVLTFQPDAAVSRDDPAIQFSTGGRSVSFAIPANATSPSGSVSFQTGTVAGTITLAMTSDLPSGGVTRTLVVNRAAPSIQSVSVTVNSSGFQVQVAGFSNTLDLSGASFHFTAGSGQSLQTSNLTVSLSSLAGQWYSGSASSQFGGQFLLVVPFTVSAGTSSALANVAVQVENAQSSSASTTASF
jgi:hypothetical protein